MRDVCYPARGMAKLLAHRSRRSETQAGVRAVHQASIASSNADIKKLSKGPHWEKALNILACLERHELQPNLATYAGLASAYAQAAKWFWRGRNLRRDWHLRYFSDITYSYLQPDASVYGALLSACAASSQWEVSIDLMENIVRRRFMLKPSVNNSIMSACAQRDQWSTALSLLHTSGHYAVQVDIIGYNIVLGACASVRSWDVALDVLRGARQHSLRPSLVTSKIILEAMAASNRWEQAMLYFQPSFVAYLSLLGSTERSGAWWCNASIAEKVKIEALHLLNDAAKPDSDVWFAIVDVLGGTLQTLAQRYALRKLLEPVAISFKELLGERFTEAAVKHVHSPSLSGMRGPIQDSTLSAHWSLGTHWSLEMLNSFNMRPSGTMGMASPKDASMRVSLSSAILENRYKRSPALCQINVKLILLSREYIELRMCAVAGSRKLYEC